MAGARRSVRLTDTSQEVLPFVEPVSPFSTPRSPEHPEPSPPQTRTDPSDASSVVGPSDGRILDCSSPSPDQDAAALRIGVEQWLLLLPLIRAIVNGCRSDTDGNAAEDPA